MADAPVDQLLSRAEDLTKGWLLTLLEQAPLGDAPAILAADVAHDGPRICDAIVRALADDVDLRRLEPGGALEMLVSQTGELAGASGPEATARAVDALGAVIWSALRDTLAHPDADLVSELAERLSLAIELVRAAALRRSASQPPGVVAPVVDEDSPRVARLPVDLPADASPAELGSRAEQGAEDSPVDPDALWVGALEDEISRCERLSTPLSLLLVELEEADRIAAIERPGDAASAFGRFAQAVRSVLRRQDMLACESDTRAWILARDTGRLGARALGTRVVSAVRAAPSWRGAPLAVSVGLAVFGEDGRDRGTLVEAAEESRFEAEARGVGVGGETARQRGPEISG